MFLLLTLNNFATFRSISIEDFEQLLSDNPVAIVKDKKNIFSVASTNCGNAKKD